MARFDDSLTSLTPSNSGKPRGFPWRLILYALVMTGAAGAAGYFAWTYRERNKDLEAKYGPMQSDLKDKARIEGELTNCNAGLTQAADQKKQVDGQLARVAKDLNATQDELTALRAARAEQEKRMAAIQAIQSEFAKMIDTGQLAVRSRRGSFVLELPSEVLFPSASADLSEKGQLAVLEVGLILKKFPDRRFLVVGHTDNQALKGSPTFTDNWQLSTARALTVTRFMVKAGMKPSALIAAGVGEHDPITDNKDARDRQRNRRIEIQLMPQLSELPPLPKSIPTDSAPAPAPAPAAPAAPAPAAPAPSK